VTLADVAAAAGVDGSTVSRVLRNDPGAHVSEPTRVRIREAARRLGYVPNAVARSLAIQRTSTLGLLIPDTSSSVFRDIIKGANAAAVELGYVLVLADASELGPASAAVRKLVLEGRVDGLLIASGTISDEIADDLVEGFHNCVLLNRRIGSKAPSVIEDDELGMFLCTNELISHGHTEIDCLAGPENIDTSRRRVAGYRRALREAGIPSRRGSVVHSTFDEAGGHAGMVRILSRRNRPTAVASASLAAAIGAISAAASAEVRIPADLSITAFHDAPIADYLLPPLTTVAMPLEELGRQAVRILHRRLQGDDSTSQFTVSEPRPTLVRRQSVSAPPAARDR
jgi:LacI family transcriptional regulator